MRSSTLSISSCPIRSRPIPFRTLCPILHPPQPQASLDIPPRSPRTAAALHNTDSPSRHISINCPTVTRVRSTSFRINALAVLNSKLLTIRTVSVAAVSGFNDVASGWDGSSGLGRKPLSLSPSSDVNALSGPISYTHTRPTCSSLCVWRRYVVRVMPFYERSKVCSRQQQRQEDDPRQAEIEICLGCRVTDLIDPFPARGPILTPAWGRRNRSASAYWTVSRSHARQHLVIGSSVTSGTQRCSSGTRRVQTAHYRSHRSISRLSETHLPHTA